MAKYSPLTRTKIYKPLILTFLILVLTHTSGHLIARGRTPIAGAPRKMSGTRTLRTPRGIMASPTSSPYDGDGGEEWYDAPYLPSEVIREGLLKGEDGSQ